MSRITFLKKLGGSALSVALVAALATLGANASSIGAADETSAITVGAVDEQTAAPVVAALPAPQAEFAAALDSAAADAVDGAVAVLFSADSATNANLTTLAVTADCESASGIEAIAGAGLVATIALDAGSWAGQGAGFADHAAT